MSSPDTSEVELEQIAYDNYIKTMNSAWLDCNAPQLFTEKYPDKEFIAITETPPKEFYTFNSKKGLLKFVIEHPYAAFRHHGFEEEIYML